MYSSPLLSLPAHKRDASRSRARRSHVGGNQPHGFPFSCTSSHMFEVQREDAREGRLNGVRGELLDFRGPTLCDLVEQQRRRVPTFLFFSTTWTAAFPEPSAARRPAETQQQQRHGVLRPQRIPSPPILTNVPKTLPTAAATRTG